MSRDLARDIPVNDFMKLMKNDANTVRLLSITDAARFLGYKTNRPISKLIQSNALPTYTLPDSKRRRIKMSDLLNLVQLSSGQE